MGALRRAIRETEKRAKSYENSILTGLSSYEEYRQLLRARGECLTLIELLKTELNSDEFTAEDDDDGSD